MRALVGAASPTGGSEGPGQPNSVHEISGVLHAPGSSPVPSAWEESRSSDDKSEPDVSPYEKLRGKSRSTVATKALPVRS